MMPSLMNKAFEPSVSFPNKITHMTAVYHTQSIHSDNGLVITADKIQDLLSSTNSRLVGLQLLEAGLQQNPDIYLKGRWTAGLFGILKGTGSTVLKNHACRLFCMIIPYIVNDPTNRGKQNEFGEQLLRLMLNGIKNDCEWFEAACEVVVKCTKYFPHAIGKSNQIQDALNEVIAKQVSESVSNKIVQLIAEIYCEMPNCVPNVDPVIYEEVWLRLYKKLFNTMQKMLDKFLALLTVDPYNDNDDEDIGSADYMFENEEESPDLYQESTRAVRRVVNLCTCLAKMLSYKTKFPVTVPVRLTIKGLTRIFQFSDIVKVKPTNIELQVFFSSLSLMQNANLVVLEALLLNFNLGSYPLIVMQLLYAALQTSRLACISSEPVYPLRLAVYVFLNKWIARLGNNGCADMFREGVFAELIGDISLDDGKSSQASTKSKKCVFSNFLKHNPVQRKVCKAALKAIESFLYCGVNLMTKQTLQELFTKVSEITSLLVSSDSYPFPYDDDSCRKHLYAVLLAIAVNSKPNQREPIQHSSSIFKMALQDPSIKVTRFCHKAMAFLRLCIHPKRPPVELVDTGKQKQTSAIPRFPQWSAEDYIVNLKIETASNVPPESTNCRIARTFHNHEESAMEEEEEAMEDDVEESHYSEQAYSEYSESSYMAKYPEQISSSQRNGEDILEVINSSECQDDSDDEEDEEDEEERSYGEEDNEDDIPTETICMPSTSKLQGMIPVHISQETDAITLEDPEYEPTKQCAKSESSIECKSKQLNGVRNLVPEEDVPSTSKQCLTSENGIDNSEEELDDEEEVEEEEEIESFPAEKRPPEFYDSLPASKKPKLENEEESEKPSEERRSVTPPLQVMKDSFCIDFKDEAKS